MVKKREVLYFAMALLPVNSSLRTFDSSRTRGLKSQELEVYLFPPTPANHRQVIGIIPLLSSIKTINNFLHFNSTRRKCSAVKKIPNLIFNERYRQANLIIMVPRKPWKLTSIGFMTKQRQWSPFIPFNRHTHTII